MILQNRKFSMPSAVVIGKFDGVHKGHQHLLELALDICEIKNLAPLAYTFPSGRYAITDDDEKNNLLYQNGIENIYCQPFTDEFKATTPEEFVRILKNDFSAKHVIVGFNFRFGKDRAGDASQMEQLCKKEGIGVTIAEPVLFENEPISSTRIRESIKNGDVKSAHLMTGRFFGITSEVMQGKKLGREMGFPTINMSTENIFLLPQVGVYATKVEIDGKTYPAITNIGANPTVDSDNKIKAETHIIGFGGDLYGKCITVKFIEKLRVEKAFKNIDELKKQISADKEETVRVFGKL
ncbi:MAG: bifunctional riboflavin kinase/FAD synthetase [Clostridia bacterium]|nr:bifunctional riboflavin kinase/FAD synthetase [Clostridia bacterium]